MPWNLREMVMCKL